MEIIRKKKQSPSTPNTSESDKAPKKYPSLYPCFFKGTFKGQLESVYKTRESNPQKVLDFKKAIMNGDILISEELTPSQKKKCDELGILLPNSILPPTPPKHKAPNLSTDHVS